MLLQFKLSQTSHHIGITFFKSYAKLSRISECSFWITFHEDKFPNNNPKYRVINKGPTSLKVEIKKKLNVCIFYVPKLHIF